MLTINYGLGKEALCSEVLNHHSFLTVEVLWRFLIVISEFLSAVSKSIQRLMVACRKQLQCI